MNTYMSITQFDAFKKFLYRELGHSLFGKFLNEFDKSTLSLFEKFQILKMIPKKECDANLAIEIFYSNFDTSRTAIRDQEWIDFLSGRSIANTENVLTDRIRAAHI